MKTLQQPQCSQMPVHVQGERGRGGTRRSMQALLQRLKASHQGAPSPPAISSSVDGDGGVTLPSFFTDESSPSAEEPATFSAVSDESFLSAEEIATFTAEQTAFLVRKRKAALGLGPIMPAESTCQTCDGVGTHICQHCGGTGINDCDKDEQLFDNERPIIANNGVIDIEWFFRNGWPCWLCRGREHVACSDCGGSGIRGGVDRYTGD